MKLLTMIRNLASRAVLHRIDDSPGLQAVQVELLSGEVRNPQRLQDYGITSRPLPGAEGIALALNGARSQTVIIRADDRRYRVVDLKPGEVCLYTDEGDTIKLARGNKIEINGAEKVTVNTKEAEVNCDDATVDATKTATIKSPAIKLDGPVTITKTLSVQGATTLASGLSVTGALTNNGVDVGSTHQHSNGTNENGNTGTPL